MRTSRSEREKEAEGEQRGRARRMRAGRRVIFLQTLRIELQSATSRSIKAIHCIFRRKGSLQLLDIFFFYKSSRLV